MILYFSGTGNSAYVAKKIGSAIQDETINLFEKIRDQDFSEIHSEKPWCVVTPTYAWRIPRILHKWLANTSLTGNKKIYFVMTCGGSIGNAGSYIKKLCVSKKMNFMGCIPIVMPENYIALFPAPKKEEALEIIRRADDLIEKASLWIKNEGVYLQTRVTPKDRMDSGLVNALFYPVFVHAKKFYATEACTSCGKCEAVCPLKNIRLKKGRPVWENHCTHCMACICGCPGEAIEYGKNSKGRRRYRGPENEVRVPSRQDSKPCEKRLSL